VPIFIINPKTGAGLNTERVTELASMIKSTKGLRIIDSFTHWENFYTNPDLIFNELVEALEIDIKTLKRKIRPKEEVREDL